MSWCNPTLCNSCGKVNITALAHACSYNGIQYTTILNRKIIESERYYQYLPNWHYLSKYLIFIKYIHFNTDIEPTTVYLQLPNYQYIFGISHITTENINAQPKPALFLNAYAYTPMCNYGIQLFSTLITAVRTMEYCSKYSNFCLYMYNTCSAWFLDISMYQLVLQALISS